MAAEFISAPEAEQDIAQAYAWYEGRRTGLGEDFLSCVDACLEAIRRAPEMHAVVHETYHRGLVRRFPYAVFYEYVEGMVIVYGVFHISRFYRRPHDDQKSIRLVSATSKRICSLIPSYSKIRLNAYRWPVSASLGRGAAQVNR